MRLKHGGHRKKQEKLNAKAANRRKGRQEIQQQDFLLNPDALVPWRNVRSGCFSLAKKLA
jgi:hypothetical protein